LTRLVLLLSSEYALGRIGAYLGQVGQERYRIELQFHIAFCKRLQVKLLFPLMVPEKNQMKKSVRSRISALLILFFNLVFTPASVQSETLLFYDNFEPFSYLNNGQTQGLFVDLVTAAFEEMENDYDLKSYPFKRALLLAEEGKGIVVGIYKSDERRQKLDFSKPFYQEKSVLFVHKEGVFPFSSVNDLKNKTIGARFGWRYGTEFDQAKERKVFTTLIGSPSQIFRLLELGRVDAVVDNELSGLSILKAMNIQTEIEILRSPLNRSPLHLGDIHIALKKGSNLGLLYKFNREIERMKVNGTYDDIMAKYQ